MRDIIGFIKGFIKGCIKWYFGIILGLGLFFAICEKLQPPLHREHEAYAASAHLSIRELAEHFNACVQAYTRTARPIPLELAEQRCSCAGEYLSTHGYGEASARDAQKICGVGG